MNSKHAASWVCLLARSRPAISALSVLATVAIAGQADRPCAAAFEYLGETDSALEKVAVGATAKRTDDVQKARTANVTVREGVTVLAADQRHPLRLQPPTPHAADVK